jgi:hypothetical protein
VELVDEESAHSVALVTVEAEDVEQPVERGSAWPVGLVDVESGVGEQAVARHVVFVGVAVEHRIDSAGSPALGHDGDGRVDDDGLARSGDLQRVGRRIPPLVVTDEQVHGWCEDPSRLTPVDQHGPGVADVGRSVPAAEHLACSADAERAAVGSRHDPRDVRDLPLRQR